MNKDIYFDIQMFAESGAEGVAGEGTESASGLTGDFKADFARHVLGKNVPGKESAPVSQNTADDKASSGTEEAATDAGEQGENTASGGEQSEGGHNTEEDTEKEFEELIKGKFKGAFQKRTQGIVNERFKKGKETEGKLKTAMDVLAPLFDRYGIEENNLEGLYEAVKGDTGIFSKRALEKGMETEEYRDTFYADREMAQNAAAEELQRRQQAANEQYQDWKRQETEIQKTYPGFNLEEAFKNDEFRQMAMGGSSLMSAYRASHFDEITAGLVAAATKRAAKNAVDSMQGNVNRPAEGGMSSAAGTVTKKDVNSLSGKDIESIIKAVGRGDKITF